VALAVREGRRGGGGGHERATAVATTPYSRVCRRGEHLARETRRRHSAWRCKFSQRLLVLLEEEGGGSWEVKELPWLPTITTLHVNVDMSVSDTLANGAIQDEGCGVAMAGGEARGSCSGEAIGECCGVDDEGGA
jgi:hypothetical protein